MVLVWLRRMKPVESAVHAFEDGRGVSLCGLMKTTPNWTLAEHGRRCNLCQKKAHARAEKHDSMAP